MASISSDDNSTTAVDKPAVVGLVDRLQSGSAVTPQLAVETAKESIQGCRQVLCRLGVAKSASLSLTTSKTINATSAMLDVVAFTDTDDLLSWSVPVEYQRAIGHLPLKFTNVYVQNAPRILVAEWPTSAHHDYFTNPKVRKVIRCGAAKGAPNSCE